MAGTRAYLVISEVISFEYKVSKDDERGSLAGGRVRLWAGGSCGVFEEWEIGFSPCRQDGINNPPAFFDLVVTDRQDRLAFENVSQKAAIGRDVLGWECERQLRLIEFKRVT